MKWRNICNRRSWKWRSWFRSWQLAHRQTNTVNTSCTAWTVSNMFRQIWVIFRHFAVKRTDNTQYTTALFHIPYCTVRFSFLFKMTLCTNWHCVQNDTVYKMTLCTKWHCVQNDTVYKLTLCTKWHCVQIDTVYKMTLCTKYQNICYR